MMGLALLMYRVYVAVSILFLFCSKAETQGKSLNGSNEP